MATKHKNNKLNPFKLKNKYKTIQMLVVVVVIGAVGVVALKKSFAATTTISGGKYPYYCTIYYESTNSTIVWHPTVRYSSTGKCVKELQGHLNKLTDNNFHQLYYLTVDGIFGSKTLAAVKDFQKRNGLEADGIVGPKTWRKIHTYGPIPICHVGLCN